MTQEESDTGGRHLESQWNFSREMPRQATPRWLRLHYSQDVVSGRKTSRWKRGRASRLSVHKAHT